MPPTHALKARARGSYARNRKRDGKDNTHKVEGNQDFTQAPGQTAPTQTPASTPTAAPGAETDNRADWEKKNYNPEVTETPDSSPGSGYVPKGASPSAPPIYPASPPELNRPNGTFITPGGTMPYGGTTLGPPEPPGGMYGGLPRSAYPWNPNNPIGTQAINLNSGAASPVPGLQARSDAFDRAQAGRVAPEAAQPTPYTPWPMQSTNAPVGATLGLGGSSAIPNQSLISNQPVGTSLQGQPAITRTAPVDQPIPSAQIGGPYTPPSQQDPRLPQQQGPTEPIPHNPPGYDAQPNTAPVNAPIPGAQGGPYMPPPQVDTRGLPPPQPPNAQPIAPALPPPQQVAPSPATPMGGASSLGGRILSYIPSLMGSAHAAEVAPGGAGRGSADTPVNYPPTGPVTPTPGPNPSAQPSGITPAQPPTQGAPAHPPAGPVVVAGTDGTVKQSQATPPLLAPNPDYGALRRAEQQHPDKLALMDKAIQAEGADGLNRAFVAATIERESHWQSGLTHGTGTNGVKTDAKGLMQVMPGTRDEIDPRHELNPLDDYDSMRLGIRYYKQLAVGPNYNLGYNTVQSAFAYRAGAAHLPEVAAKGWQGYIDSAPNNSVRLERMSQVHDMETQFPGTTLTAAMVPGGTPEHQPVDAQGLVQAYHQGGPDGALSQLQETGPAGLGDTDRWRGAQSALEHYLIISGQPEKAGMAAEWVAQVSHQGAVSHLLAADQALLGGDKETAINHILRSYAFYPDGAYARAGTDKNGDIWVYKIKDGGDGTPLGQPMKVTHELIAQTLIAMRNPQTYVETMDKHRKGNAEIDLHNAQTEWYKARPEIEAMKDDTRKQIGEMRAENERQRATDRATAAAQRAGEHAEMDTHVQKEVGDLYKPENKAAEVSDEDWAKQSEIHLALRRPEIIGGLGVSSETARQIAAGLANGTSKTPDPKRPRFSVGAGPTKDGKQGYAILDGEGKPYKSLTEAQFGNLVRAIPGLAGSAPLAGSGAVTPPVAAPTPALTPAKPPAPSNTSAPYVPEAVPMMSGLNRRPLTMAA